MIEIKRCNYITGNPSDVSYAVKKIVDFLDMEGRNPVLFCKPRSSNSTATTLKYLMEPKIIFNNIEDFTEDESNIQTEAFAILNPSIIKLADGSNTTFDGNNPDIRFKRGGRTI